MQKLVDHRTKGPDGIDNLFPKHLAGTLGETFQLWFTIFIDKGIFPNILKTSEITPICKDGD